ncbi:GNAT family N-acetyltransferase [Aestuariirhabdus sp. Z084]|uniref:GNAT family N-acetyltransferase n=1 Tax=Aestuariirhabdus haliotis TaxID=2918751 RepID=UPI00201B4274|nr:GNAT family N-acetyltransferase [Aestuariirhabdus haliotis]MCL6417016.1 GNAT family N-acetyltransferase [Aestuariirhabdus haliotis]MCL6421049.1 GNAT family N-acetyltransferase [Aestuariirhabdus haliotis]
MSLSAENPLVIEPYEASHLEELAAFRFRAWCDAGIDPRCFPEQQWSDPHDHLRLHWVVRDRGEIVAAASLGIHERLCEVDEAEVYIAAGIDTPGSSAQQGSKGPVGAPARVAVLSAYRRHGFASLLLDQQDLAMRDAGVHFAVRQSSPSMQRLLLPRGWIDHGPAPADPRFPEVDFHIMSWDLL